MEPFNNVMNGINDWSLPRNPYTNEPQSFFKREVATRVATVTVGAPVEITAVAQNIFRAVTNGVFIPLKIVVNVFSCISGSNSLDDLDDFLPKVQSFLKAVYRVVAYAIGTFSTFTLGFISPSANFKLHEALGLAENRRERDLETAKALADLADALRAEQTLKEAAIKWQADLMKIEHDKAAAEATKKVVQEKAAEAAARKSEEDRAAAEATQSGVTENEPVSNTSEHEQASSATYSADVDTTVSTTNTANPSTTKETSVLVPEAEDEVPEIDDIDIEIELEQVVNQPVWYKPWTWSKN